MITEIDKSIYYNLKEVSSPLSNTEMGEIDYYLFDSNFVYKFDGDYYLRYGKFYLKIVGYKHLKSFLNVYASENHDLIIEEIENGFDVLHMERLIVWWAIDIKEEYIIRAILKNYTNKALIYTKYDNFFQNILKIIITRNFTQELKELCFNLKKSFNFDDIIKFDEYFKRKALNSDKIIVDFKLKSNLNLISQYIENPDFIKKIENMQLMVRLTD